MNLLECLSTIKDSRRLQGQRYPSVSLLLIIILGILRGKYGYRELGRFCAMNQSSLLDKFHFRNNRVPSHVSIRSFILAADFGSIQDAFYHWAKSYVPLEKGEWISIDGKSIRCTVSDCSNTYQDFVSLVSLFSSKREQIIYAQQLEHKKQSEIQTVNELLEILDLKDMIFTLDALHCKKNASPNR